jgi:exodeoxyribonuclease VII large subunit
MSRYSLDDIYEQSSIDFTYHEPASKPEPKLEPKPKPDPEPEPKSSALSVTAALALTKKQLESIRLSIIGEISEISDKPGYKAVYFTISDKSSALPCLIWRNVYDHQNVRLERGMLVEISGKFSLYAAKGRMNFEVSSITLAGEGQLRLQVAQLAKKLQAQGLMDPSRKLSLPIIPQKLALVTSPRGKAVHDVIRTLRRRFPLVQVLLFGVAVEGQNAAAEIIKGLQAAQESDADVILLVRGGGSYEDLMPFNDEHLAVQVANSKTPIITGIGHEPDNSIADMVASFRASTPTAAAERAVPEITEIAIQLQAQQAALNRNLSNQIATRKMWLNGVLRLPLFNNKQSLTAASAQNLEQAGIRLQTAIPNTLAQNRALIQMTSQRLPIIGKNILAKHQDSTSSSNVAMRRVGKTILGNYQNQLTNAAGKLESLSPLAILKRGYSATYDQKGQIVNTITKVQAQDKLNIRLQDGIIDCIAIQTHE